MCQKEEVKPPAQPAFILRGHSVQIHAVHFTPGNRRLLTGDADGWVISWNLSFKRPVAVWKAHAKTILGLGSWRNDILITHGRDNKLIAWKVGETEERELDVALPVDNPPIMNKHPWILHCLMVNALSFCAFAMCNDDLAQSDSPALLNKKNPRKPALIAVPNKVDSNGIDLYQLPSENRVGQIQASREITTGMVMSLGVQTQNSRIQVAAGYESGYTAVYTRNDPDEFFQLLYARRPHTQPVLSLLIAPSNDYYVTTSADDTIAKHPFPSGHGVWQTALKPLKLLKTKHSGQQGASTRSDGKIFATAGWDSKVRVYSSKTMKELAVLKWHKQGCYTTAFAHVVDQEPAKKPPCPTMNAVDTLRAADSSPTSKEDVQESEEKLPGSEQSSHPTEKMDLAEDTELLTQEATTEGTSSELSPASVKSLGSIVQRRRDEKAQTTHWLAAGSKDGKISLWDIY